MSPDEVTPDELDGVTVTDADIDLTSDAAGEAGSDEHGGAERRGVTRRLVVLATLCVVLVGAVAAAALTGREDAPAPLPDVALDAWAPYWTLDASNEVAATRLRSMREVSPFWFNAVGAADIVVDQNASESATAEFMEIAERSGVRVIPSIVDAMPAGGMAGVLADPASRQVHIDTLAAFADAGGYDGIDLDYEQFAFADGRDTWAATRPNWVAFIEALSQRLAEDGRTLTVSIPPVYDDGRTDASGFWVYDYAAIVPHVEHIRVMAYDFSVRDPGPIAPLEFVERAIRGAIESTGTPEKIVLGVPAYGRNWPVGTSGECDGVEFQGMTSTNARTVDDLIVRRGGVPAFDDVTGEWSFAYDLAIEDTTCVQQRQVHYVDGDGVRLRMDLARENRLGGVSLWAFGFEDADVWDEILGTVAQN
ncbi:MAG: glycosyl hydrolase family 18 protein [Ilumatobacter sp.]